MMLALPHRSPAVRLRDAREDHATCLRLAASYRLRISRGEPAVREQHAWALAHCRTLRARFTGLTEPRASPN
ncbi:hypothetical protein J2X36_003706 [Methylobacterium sp. BE186]|uniref:hypothetical protein n=1 Tax=Methylobacterium sp. BE186 TaxID=2817715 RepID=UPI0028657C99|nr:hypothetical protein [Methylobacterium sp. BE186]MDR7038934.1 hypothetical protein [Methylobacterium sp. BE186]